MLLWHRAEQRAEKTISQYEFILYKSHLKDHFYETAEALGIWQKDRYGWVEPRIRKISDGNVEDSTLAICTIAQKTLLSILNSITKFFSNRIKMRMMDESIDKIPNVTINYAKN